MACGAAPAAPIALAGPPRTVVVGNCNDSGPGSLRETLVSAAEGDTVDLAQLPCSTISLLTGALVVAQADISIVGPGESGLRIDGGGANAILDHRGGGVLGISGLSLVNGSAYSDGSGARAYAAGACIRSDGDVAIDDVAITHCVTSGGGSAKYGSGGAQGGAAWVRGNARISNSTISDSSATVRGTGYAVGGGLFAGGGLSLRSSTVSGNVASSQVEFNSFAGGVFAAGEVTIVESTVSGNSADEFGGLDLNDPYGNTASVISSTVSGNSARFVGGVFAHQPLDLYNSTIAFNTSSIWTSGGMHFAAGVHVSVPGHMHSTIIANNVNMDVEAPHPTSDLTGAPSAFVDGGHDNVMSCDIACPADTTHEDPGLLALQDNGGPTRTHAPTPGAWDRFGGSNERGAPWDQRGVGFPRESPGDRIEIGALQTNSDIVFVNGFH